MNIHAPIDGLHALKDLPQRGSISSIAMGTGYAELDEIWKLYPGQLTVCTGVAGHGKSTFLLNVLANIGRENNVASFLYVPENEGHIHEKMKLIWGNRPGFETFETHQCFVQSSAPEYYDSKPKTLKWVMDRAVDAVDKARVGVVLIDPWNELERAKDKNQLMTDYIAECLMYLKGLCRSKEVAVILVAHPTKAGVEAGKVPSLADIEGSMNWYNKCDNGLIVARDPIGNTTRVISAKVREIGAGRRGECHFYVDPNTGLFTAQHGAVSL